MIVVGLTGSIAMGKSTAAAMLRDMPGVAVHCADEAVRALYANRIVTDMIAAAFPDACDRKTGALDKTKLIAILGRSGENWDRLEKILHPFVREAQQKFLREQQALGTAIAVLDIPLLFETGAEAGLDDTICVTAPPFIQRQRLDARIRAGRLTEEDALFRLSRQMPDAQKRARAGFIVQTGAGMAGTRRELERIVRILKERNAAPAARPAKGGSACPAPRM